MNVLSLFDGISCGQLALQRAGIKVDNYFASEIDKYAIKITQRNFPNTFQLGDVNNWTDWKLPKIDLLIGGSPCQGFSIAGAGLNFSDPRSKLFFVFLEILKHHKPKYWMLENVKMKKEWQNIITSYLGIEPILINSALVSAQNRQRLYWTNIPNVTQPEDRHIYLKDVIEHGEVDRQKSYCIDANYFMGGSIKKYKEKMNKKIPTHQSERRLMVHEPKEPFYRIFTPLECERLQIIPEGYTEGISNTQRYKALGNGWTVDVIAHIFSFIPKENL